MRLLNEIVMSMLPSWDGRPILGLIHHPVGGARRAGTDRSHSSLHVCKIDRALVTEPAAHTFRIATNDAASIDSLGPKLSGSRLLTASTDMWLIGTVNFIVEWTHRTALCVLLFRV